MKADFRHEYKYLCSYDQLVLERKRLEPLLRPDPHAGAAGSYQIRSLYFDTPDDTCYYENEDGVDPRSKYRMRIYNCSGGLIHLERKSKCRAMTHKDACRITKEQALALIAGKIPPVAGEGSQLLRKMLTEMRLRVMRPAVIVQYERVPFVHPMGNVRITLDQQIASSQAIDRFFSPDLPLRRVLPGQQGILEVKWDQFLPSYIYEHLQLEGLQWTSFSKYYLCRRFNTHGGTKS